MLPPSVAARVIFAVPLAVLRAGPAGGQSGPSSTTTTSGPTSGAKTSQAPSCSSLGAMGGHCGPAGQYLEHVDTGPPACVCVNGGVCVEVSCSADA